MTIFSSSALFLCINFIVKLFFICLQIIQTRKLDTDDYKFLSIGTVKLKDRIAMGKNQNLHTTAQLLELVHIATTKLLLCTLISTISACIVSHNQTSCSTHQTGEEKQEV